MVVERRRRAIDGARGPVVLDAGGCLVGPGLVDLHTHLRQPGHEEAETVETGARAAALGGYTAVLAMPNTDPPIDSAAVAREVLALGRGAPAEVAVAGAITVGRAGERARPDGRAGRPRGPHLHRRRCRRAGRGVSCGVPSTTPRGLGVTLAQHCEDSRLAGGGAMHEGAWSSRLGLPACRPRPRRSMVARDLALVRADRRARALPAPLHRGLGGRSSAGPRPRAAGHGRGGAALHRC